MITKNKEYPAKFVGAWNCIVPACTVLFEDVEPTSLDDAGRDLTVHGLCTCSDAVLWCKYWTASGIAKQAAETFHDESKPQSDGDALVLQHQPDEPATSLVSGPARRIDLIVAYEGSLLADASDHGRLVQFKLDGEVAVPPTWKMPEIYHWLHEHGYIPDGLNWLTWWENGVHQQWQSYVRDNVRSG